MEAGCKLYYKYYLAALNKWIFSVPGKSANNETLRLGLMTPYTSVVGFYRQEFATAETIACEQVNQKSGILSRPLELIIVDDGSMPDKATHAAEKFITDFQCHALTGTLLSSSQLDVTYKVSLPLRILLLNVYFYEGSILHEYLFTFSALPNQKLNQIFFHLVKQHGLKFYFAEANCQWPRGSIATAKKLPSHFGADVAREDYYEFGEAKHGQIALNIANSAVNVFIPYFAGYDQIAMIKAFVDAQLRDKITVAMAHFDPEEYLEYWFYITVTSTEFNNQFVSIKKFRRH